MEERTSSHKDRNDTGRREVKTENSKENEETL